MGGEAPYNLRMPAGERRRIFREMIKGELVRGPLTPRRHRDLVAYGAKLGIHPTESTDWIAETAQELGHAPPLTRGQWCAALKNALSPRVVVTVSILVLAVACSNRLLTYLR